MYDVDFFRDEVRCGFYIPTAIKQAWAGSLCVLAEVDRICQKHDIAYFAEWGTLLGAVRHSGFVPWDDDLDIGMRRKDYIRFRQAVSDGELPQGFALQDFRSQEDHWLFITRVVNTNRINFDPAHLNQFFNFPYIASIDIFLYDDLYADPKKENERCDEVKEILATADGIVQGCLQPSAIEGQLALLQERYGITFRKGLSPQELGVMLYDLAEQQMARTKPEESDSVGQIFPWILKGGSGLPKRYYEKTVRLPFEQTTIPVAAAYDKILRSRYGSYFQIHKVWGGHGYPFFEGQKRMLEEIAGHELQEYGFDPAALSCGWHGHGKEEVTVPVADGQAVMEEVLGIEGEILFLAAGASLWSGFQPLYQHFIKNDRCHVTVVALPMVRKDAYGRMMASDDEIDRAARIEDYPDDIRITEWWDLDIRRLRPSLVFIQAPYDGENPVMTIPPEYYTTKIRRYAERIVYVPPFFGDEFEQEAVNDVYNLKHYVCKPGVVWSDLVLLRSEVLRQRWIEKLTEWAGSDTADYWKQKLACVTFDEETVSEVNVQNRKRLLWCIGANALTEEPDCIVESLLQRIRTFKEFGSNLQIGIYIYPIEEDSWKMVNPSLTEEMLRMLSGMIEEDSERFFFVDDPGKETVSSFDAYYGSPSPLIVEFSRMKKPVMLADYGLR